MSTIETAAAPGRHLALPRAVALRVAAAAGVAGALAYLSVLALQMRALLTFVYQDADVASGPVLGEAAAHATAGEHILLGHIAWYPQLWAYQLTAGLPGRDVLWQAAPLLFAAAGVAIVAVTAARLAGRWAALFVVLILGCASGPMLDQLARPVQHQTTYLGTCVLGGLLVLAVRWLPRRRAAALAVAVGAAVLAGLFLASDRLLGVTGVAPMVLAAATLAARRPGRATREVLALAAGVALLAGLVAVMIPRVAALGGVEAIPLAPSLAALEDLRPHADLLVRGVLDLGNAYHFAPLGVLALAGVGFSLSAGRRSVVCAPRPCGSADDGALAWNAFWGISAALLIATWMFSGQVENMASVRYLPTLVFGAAAVAPLALRGQRELALALAVVWAVANAATLGGAVKQYEFVPTSGDVDRLVAVAQREGLRYGYGHYWTASSITWMSRFRVRVAPVGACEDVLCPADLHQAASWYRPRRATRTFVIVAPDRRGLLEPPPGLGRPVARRQAGQLTMYVYDYDVARRFVAGYSQSNGSYRIGWLPNRRSATPSSSTAARTRGSQSAASSSHRSAP